MLGFGFGLGLAFLKHLCDSNKHQKLKLAYITAGKQKTCRLVIRDSQATC